MIVLQLYHIIILSTIVFTIGITGIFLNRKNVIVILMSIELMILSVNINFVTFSAYLSDISGQIFSIFILTTAAAEAAVGLAIFVVFFRTHSTIAIEDASNLKDIVEE